MSMQDTTATTGRNFDIVNAFNNHGELNITYGTTTGAVPTNLGISLTSGGAVYFDNIGTTASAANAYLDNSSRNSLLRSTSSGAYKTGVEPVENEYVDAAVNGLEAVFYYSTAPADKPDWSYYGLVAEAVALVDPRLVHWTYPAEAYELVDVKEEIEVPDTEDFEEPIVEITLQDDKAIETVVLRTTKRQRVREIPVYSADGYPIVVGGPDGIPVQKTHIIPLMRKETIVRQERRLRDDAKLVPDGVMYDRLAVLLLQKIQRMNGIKSKAA
jgi:hypothetical protein